MDINAPVGAKQMRLKPVVRGAGDHAGAKRDEAKRIVAAMAMGATKPSVEPAKGQFAAILPCLIDPYPRHLVVPKTDDQRPNRGAIAIRQGHHMAIEHIMRVIRDHDLAGVCTGNPCDS